MENTNETLPTSQQSITPRLAKKWYQHTGIIWIVALGIIAALSVWLYFAKQPAQNANPIIINHTSKNPIATTSLVSTKSIQETTITPTSINNWQTYNNSGLGFRFQYPNNWSMNVSQPSIGQDVTIAPNGSQTSQSGYGDYSVGVDFSVETNSSSLSLSNWINQNSRNDGTNTPINVDGIIGINKSFKDDISGDSAAIIYLPLGGNIITFSATGNTDLQTLNQIISTFQFIKPQTNLNNITSNIGNDWVNISGCATDGGNTSTPFTISYPQSLPIDTKAIKQSCIIYDDFPDSYNYTLPVSDQISYPVVQLDTDLKSVYYIKTELQGNTKTYSLYKADIHNKTVILLDTYGVNSSWDFKKNIDVTYYNVIPSGNGYILYNWFTKDPTSFSSSTDASTYLALKIKTPDNKLIYQASCQLNYNNGFTDAPTSFQTSTDGKHFAFSCNNDLYIGDWQSVNKISLPAPAKEASNVYFITNSRVGFQDWSVNVGDCRAKAYSIDISGNNLKDEGTTYACY